MNQHLRAWLQRRRHLVNPLEDSAWARLVNSGEVHAHDRAGWCIEIQGQPTLIYSAANVVEPQTTASGCVDQLWREGRGTASLIGKQSACASSSEASNE